MYPGATSATCTGGVIEQISTTNVSVMLANGTNCALEATDGTYTYKATLSRSTADGYAVSAGTIATAVTSDADATLVSLAQERVAAWIALYRAAGGGWEPEPSNRNSP